MATTAAKQAFGTALSLGGTAIGELSQIEDDDGPVEFADASNHDSPSGYAEEIPTLQGNAVLTFQGNFKNVASQSALKTAFEAATLSAMVLTPPGSVGTWSGNGFVRDLKYTQPMNGIVGFSATIEIVGNWTYAP